MSDKRIPLIGEAAPEFSADTTMWHINFPSDNKGDWIILFSHPGDFTPVCTTEFMAFQEKMPEFDKRGVKLFGYSVDTVEEHQKWVDDIKEKFWITITFPIIAGKEVWELYWMVHPEQSSTVTVRAVFIINPEWKIAAILYYPLSAWRNIDEIIRLVDALQMSYNHSRSTPANWPKNSIFGDRVIVPIGATEEERKANMEKYECKTWYLCTDEMPK